MKRKLIALTEVQSKQLEGLLDEIGRMSDEEKPGMLLAQLDRTHMICGIVSHDNAKMIVKAMGGDPHARMKSIKAKYLSEIG